MQKDKYALSKKIKFSHLDFFTRWDSPVNELLSTIELPVTTIPSQGTQSSVLILIIDPI